MEAKRETNPSRKFDERAQKVKVMRSCVVALLLLTASTLRAQEGWKVIVNKPEPKEIFGWAQSPPSIPIQASLQRNGEVVVVGESVKRLFLTAQIFAGERLLDNVPLWDDGSHGDEKAKDGNFTSTYLPPQTGDFKLRVRAQADLVEGGKVLTREFWSEFVPFSVVAIPYPHITSPEPGSKTGAKVKIRARLLLQNKPFNQRDETLQAKVIAKSEGKTLSEATLSRSGSVLSGNLNLPRLGTYQLTVSVSVHRSGKKLVAESEPVEIQVTRPPWALLVVAIIAFVLYLLLPPKEPPLWYRHHIRVGETKVELNADKTETVSGISVTGFVDSPKVTVETPQGDSETLKEGESKLFRWREGDQPKEVRVRYEKAEPQRDKPGLFARFLPNTFARFLCLLIALAALGWWLYTWHQLKA